MTTVEALFLRTLRAALWQETLAEALTPDEAQAVLDEARQQAVEALVCGALVDGGVKLTKPLIARCLRVLRETAQENAHLNAELARFADFMEHKGMALMVVKGQVNATCYPRPERRGAGDVDFLVRPDCFAPMKAIVEQQIGKPIPDKGGKHINFEGNGVDYEMHRRLADFYVRRHRRYFEALCRAAFAEPRHRVAIGGAGVATLPATENALFVFIHLFWHFICGGAGLRQFADMTRMLHAWHEEIDAPALRRHLRALGLEPAYRAFGWVCVAQLGLPEAELPYALTRRDARRGQRVLRAVVRFGNLGRKVDHLVKKANAAHTVQTAWGVLSQAVRFLPLAPGELAAIFPMQTLEKARRLIRRATH